MNFIYDINGIYLINNTSIKIKKKDNIFHLNYTYIKN